MELLCRKAEGKSKSMPLHTLVEIDQSECPELDHTSYINVNASFSKNDYTLTKLATYSPCSDVKIDESVIRKIDVALLSSPTKSLELDRIIRERLKV